MSSDGRPVTGRLILLCGTSFAGKSTVGEFLRAELGATVVSLDEINERRGLRGGDGIAIEERQRTQAAIEPAERLTRLRCNRERLARNDIVDTVMETHLDRFEFPQDEEAPITVRSADDLTRTLAPRLRPVT